MSGWQILGDQDNASSKGWKVLDAIPGTEKLGLPDGPKLAHPSLQTVPQGAEYLKQKAASALSTANEVAGPKALYRAATTPIAQQAHDILGTGKQASTVAGLYDDVTGAIGNAADKYVQPVVDKVAGAGTYLGAKQQFGEGVQALNEIPRAVMGLADFGTTPTGMVLADSLPVIDRLPVAAKPLIPAYFGTEMAPGAAEAAKEAYADPSTPNIVRAGVQGAMVAAPLLHAVPALRNRKASTPVVEDTTPVDPTRRPANEEALQAMWATERNPQKRVALERQAIEEGITLPDVNLATPAEASWKILEPAAEIDANRVEPPPIAERQAAMSQQFAGQPDQIAQQAYSEVANVAPQGSPAEQSAQGMNPLLEYERLFDEADTRDTLAQQQANALARKRAGQPSIPETGIPENVARAQDARDRLSMQLTGRPFAELSNPDRIAIDELVSQGHVGAIERPAPPRVSPEPGQPIVNRPLQHPSLRRRQVPSPETAMPSPERQAVEAPAAEGPSFPERQPVSEPPREEVIQQSDEAVVPPEPPPIPDWAKAIPDSQIDKIAADKLGALNLDAGMRESIREAIANNKDLFEEYLNEPDNRPADISAPEPARADEAQRGQGNLAAEENSPQPQESRHDRQKRVLLEALAKHQAKGK